MLTLTAMPDIVYRMVEYTALRLDLTYAALSDPWRRAILARLTEGRARVTEIAAPFDISLNAVSKHLKVLERAGLVTRTVAGRDHWLTLSAEPLMEASGWIETYRLFWEQRLDALEGFLVRDTSEE